MINNRRNWIYLQQSAKVFQFTRYCNRVTSIHTANFIKSVNWNPSCFILNIANRTTKFTTIRSRSEEHTSELQSRPHLVCRLLLEKKKKKKHETSNRRRTTYYMTRSTKHTYQLHRGLSRSNATLLA